jgi:glutaredoxin-like protein NrdH
MEDTTGARQSREAVSAQTRFDASAAPREIIDPRIDPTDIRIMITTKDGIVLKSDTDVHLAALLADQELGEGWETREAPLAEHWDFEEYLDFVGDHAAPIESPAPARQEEPAPLTIYTTPGCPGCALTQHKLEDAGIAFDVVDLSTRPGLVQQFIDDGLASAPIIETPDGRRTSGFRPDRIKAIIAAAPATQAAAKPATPAPAPTAARPRSDIDQQARGRTR